MISIEPTKFTFRDNTNTVSWRIVPPRARTILFNNGSCHRLHFPWMAFGSFVLASTSLYPFPPVSFPLVLWGANPLTETSEVFWLNMPNCYENGFVCLGSGIWNRTPEETEALFFNTAFDISRKVSHLATMFSSPEYPRYVAKTDMGDKKNLTVLSQTLLDNSKSYEFENLYTLAAMRRVSP